MSFYNYRLAEAMLDKWCLADVRPVGFRRVYLKLKTVVLATAAIDYADGLQLTPESIACAWEELQFACTGQGEAGLQGYLQQLWSYCRDDEKPAFRKLCDTAFALAEDTTPSSVPRLYLQKHRRQSLDWLSDEPCLRERRAPYRGPRIRDLVEDEPRARGRVEQVLAYLAAQEEAERTPETPTEKAGHLRLVPGENDK